MTLLEKFKLDHPLGNGYSPAEIEECMIGCPRSYGYTLGDSDREFCDLTAYDRSKYASRCIACWNREYQGQKEAEPELKFELKEEKKMKNLRALIESKVEDAIASGKIDDYIGEAVENMNLDDEIDDLIETEVDNLIEDYVGPILAEAVRDAVNEALEKLFN